MASSPTSFMGQISHSPKSRGSYQRPRLMRSSATAPCVATSNASRNDLASLHPTSRASTLLSRVASYSLGRPDEKLRIPADRRQSASPQRRSHSPHDHDEPLNGEKDNLYVDRISQVPAEGGYFSFPNFEDFHEDPEVEGQLEKVA